MHPHLTLRFHPSHYIESYILSPIHHSPRGPFPTTHRLLTYTHVVLNPQHHFHLPNPHPRPRPHSPRCLFTSHHLTLSCHGSQLPSLRPTTDRWRNNFRYRISSRYAVRLPNPHRVVDNVLAAVFFALFGTWLWVANRMTIILLIARISCGLSTPHFPLNLFLMISSCRVFSCSDRHRSTTCFA